MSSALRLVSQRGMERASVEAIARRAGFTKGAFYSNFRTKDELLLALLDEKFAEQIDRIEHNLTTDVPPEAVARHAGEDFARFLRADPDWERLYIEFVAHAARHTGFRNELLGRLRRMEERLGEVYRRWIERAGLEPPIPLADVTLMTSLMADGFLLRRRIEPELSEELYGTMLAVFMLGLGELWHLQNPDAVLGSGERPVVRDQT
jgi:AcrR family transcriptional regulator